MTTGAEHTKRCPFCAEEILEAAIKCKHCGSGLVAAPPTAQPPVPQGDPRGRQFARVLLGFFVLLLCAPFAYLAFAIKSCSDHASASAPALASTSVPMGEKGIIQHPTKPIVPCFETKEIYDAAMKAAAANDNIGWQTALLGSYYLDRGTEVLVLESGGAFTYAKKVRVTSGPFETKACWLSSERISK